MLIEQVVIKGSVDVPQLFFHCHVVMLKAVVTGKIARVSY